MKFKHFVSIADSTNEKQDESDEIRVSGWLKLIIIKYLGEIIEECICTINNRVWVENNSSKNRGENPTGHNREENAAS